MAGFALATEVGEHDIFGIIGIVRYSWVIWLFIPFGMLSLLLGIILKKENQNYKKNFIVAFICIPLMLIFGSYRFIFSNIISYKSDILLEIENKTTIDIPNQVKIATNNFETYTVSYVKIIEEVEKNCFEEEIKNSSLWESELSTKIKNLLPIDIQYDVELFDNYLFYNITNNEYNLFPNDGEYECVFIAYQAKKQRLIILDGYTINIT